MIPYKRTKRRIKEVKIMEKNNRCEEWKEYDENNNVIHYKDSDGYEYWKEYDENNNVIHYKDSNGFEYL